MNDIEKILEKYPEGYWDFKGKMKEGIHKLGKYPATMVPAMQFELLKLLKNKVNSDDITLLDPFCGSGTTLVLAQELQMKSVGMDINPYAALLSRVKTQQYLEEEIQQAIIKTEEKLHHVKEVKNHDFYNIKKWFRDDIIHSLSKIKYVISLEKNKSIRLFFWVCFSEVIHKFSNDRTSTFKLHVLKEEKIKEIEDKCIEFFIETIYKNSKHLNFQNDKKSDIIYGSCIDTLKQLNQKVDIICTSPPYGDNATTVTYGQFSILLLKWIDLCDLECESNILDGFSTIDSISVGGSKREQIQTKNIKKLNTFLDKISIKKQAKVINFFEDYYEVIKQLEKTLKKNGYLIFTVGNRNIDDVVQPLDEITIEIGAEVGLKFVTMFNRNIFHKKTSAIQKNLNNNKSVKSITAETILIFTK